MAKKKKFKISEYCNYAAILFGVAAICMIFLTCASYSGIIDNYDFTGYNVAFGYAEKKGSVSLEILSFSFLNFLPYLLVLVGVLGVVMQTFGNKTSSIVGLVAFVAFVVAAVLFFFAAKTVVLPEDSLLSKDNFTLGIGAILSGVFSAVSGLALLAKKFL